MSYRPARDAGSSRNPNHPILSQPTKASLLQAARPAAAVAEPSRRRANMRIEGDRAKVGARQVERLTAVRQGKGGGEASGTSHFPTSVHAGRAQKRRHAVRLGSNNPTPLEKALEAAIKAVRWLGVSTEETNISSLSRNTRDGRRTAEEPGQALPPDDRPTLRLSRTAPDVFRQAASIL